MSLLRKRNDKSINNNKKENILVKYIDPEIKEECLSEMTTRNVLMISLTGLSLMMSYKLFKKRMRRKN